MSACPAVSLASVAQEAITKTRECLSRENPTDTNTCEYYNIGENHTLHTHPRGTPVPSDVDIDTTTKLNKEWLCLALVPQKKVICTNIKTQAKCEHDLFKEDDEWKPANSSIFKWHFRNESDARLILDQLRQDKSREYKIVKTNDSTYPYEIFYREVQS